MLGFEAWFCLVGTFRSFVYDLVDENGLPN
jgi:hypothetical protein